MKILKVIGYTFLFLLLLFSVALCYISIWGVWSYGDIDVEKIVFHLFMPLEEAPADWRRGIHIPIILTIVTSLVIFFFSTIISIIKYILKRECLLIALICISFFVFDGWYTNKHFLTWDFIKRQYKSSKFIEKHYVNPKSVKLEFPKQKKNLIYIMVESLESSYQDKANGGLLDHNYIPEMTKLAKENINFSFSDKIEGAAVPPESGWTIAAMVAQMAGIPLKLYGYTYKDNNGNGEIDNDMGKYSYFLPGVKTLGDILLENGYKNYFILGTHAKYAGKSEYMVQHGKYQIMDEKVINDKLNKKGSIKDKDLFDFIRMEIPEIANNQPFTVLIQTNDTHFGKKEDFKETSKEVSGFVNWIKAQPFFENTVIVIIGDHCNMNSTDFNNIEDKDFRYAGNIKRKIYNVFINSAVKASREKNRKFSTLDMFPTILASMGVKIQGNRLGLGRNLFSNQRTLLERYGDEFLFQELKKKSNWYNKHLLYKQ